MTDNAKLDLLLSEMKEMKTDMQEMKTDMQEMKTDMQEMKTDMQEMKQDIHLLKDDAEKLKEEIRVNIQRVAEGHLDLSRNLHDAMRSSNEVEMLAIKVRMLESDVKDLKTRLA